VRQWVLSPPIPLRLLPATQPKLVTPVLQVVHCAITHLLLQQAGLKADQADSGAVMLIQRLGSAANLSVHLHCLVLDDVYRCTEGERFLSRRLRQRQELRALVMPAGPHEYAGVSELVATEPGCAHRAPARSSWTRPLKRVFEIDLEHCPNCGGEHKIVAAILEARVIEQIRNHPRLQARVRVPARGQTQHAA
jgi:hypothetical protein